MASKKKAAAAQITLSPTDMGILPGNQYVASIETPKGEGEVWFRLTPSSSGIAYATRDADGRTSASFIIEKSADYHIWFERAGKVLAEMEFSA